MYDVTREELVAAVEAEEREWLSTDDIHPYKSRVQVHEKDEPDGERFFLIDDKVSFFVKIIAEQCWGEEDTT